MKRQLSLLAVALLLAQPVLAKDIPLNRAAASRQPFAARSWPTCAPPAATPLSSPNIRRILTPLI